MSCPAPFAGMTAAPTSDFTHDFGTKSPHVISCCAPCGAGPLPLQEKEVGRRRERLQEEQQPLEAWRARAVVAAPPRLPRNRRLPRPRPCPHPARAAPANRVGIYIYICI
jgi:hypothetical protein